MKTEVRPLWKDVLAAIWLGMVIPGIVLHACVLMQRKTVEPQQVLPTEIEISGRQITLIRSEDGSREVLDIQDYLTGVLLAEMPASFEEEALKAQSVAARTYTMKACLGGGKHGDGSLCDNPGCCQGYLTEEAYLSQGGTQEALDKVRNAAADTTPFVLQYDGELIEAVYFSSSGGKTESALAVWGADFPYLQSVESPGEAAAAYEGKVLCFTIEEVQERLGILLEGTPETWFSDVSYTEGGGVAFMSIMGNKFTGVQLRNLLALPSTAFSVTAEGNQIIITTNGYGHRVGLSQYGANAMAQNGSSYRQILAHFYPGATLVPIE